MRWRKKHLPDLTMRWRFAGRVLSARKFVFTGRYFMAELHGCVRHERSAFLSCFSSRLSQPSWTSASPVGHPRFSVLRHAVRRQELRGNRSMGQDQDITLMHRLGFTRRPPKAGGIRKVLIALNAKAFEHALTQWVGTLLSRPITARPSLPKAYALDRSSRPISDASRTTVSS